MLRFTDKPYIFKEARPSRFVFKIAMCINRFRALPGKRHRIASINATGKEKVAQLRDDPDVRLIFVSNHSTHSDVEIVMEVMGQCKLWGCFMAAHEVFVRSRIQSWVMQKMGAFSVDRERVDRRSIKEGVRIAQDKRFCLGLFPEGNVVFTNERVRPFLDGASFMAIKAQRDLKDSAKVFIIPTSVRVTHLKDVRGLLRTQLNDLVATLQAEHIDVHRDESLPFHEQLIMTGYSILCRGLKRRGFEPNVDIESWRKNPDQVLENAAAEILGELESEMAIEAKGSALERARAVRSQLAKMRLDENQDEKKINSWDDKSMLLLRVRSYESDYLRSCPSVDRCGETLEKMREDATEVLIRPESDRHANVHFGHPIPVTGKKVGDLTRELEEAVDRGLAAYKSPHPGGELMER